MKINDTTYNHNDSINFTGSWVASDSDRIFVFYTSESKPGFAFSIAKMMQGSSKRDEQYLKIIDKCIDLERLELAMMISDEVDAAIEQNKQYKKIIETGSRIRDEEGSNR